MTILSYAMILLFVFSVASFVYEGIIAPTLRLSLRYELFRVRDQLRDLKIQHGDGLSDELFSLLEGGIHNSIVWTHALTLSRLWQIEQQMALDQGMRQRVQWRAQMIQASDLPEVQLIAARMGKLMRRAYVINSVVALFPVFPLVGFYKCMQGLRKWNTLLKTIVFLPEKDVARISHSTYVGTYGHGTV